MATAPRRRSGGLVEQPKRRSQRLRKGIFPEYKKSPALEAATPRTVFRNVLQTQSIVSPVVPEKADTPKPVETAFKIPSRKAADSNLELSLTGPVPEETFHPALSRRGKKKKVRLSAFERAVDKQLPSNTAKSFLDNTSLTRSPQVSLGTPVTPLSDGKRGLNRRPKSYKGVNVMTFEGGIEQNLQQIKGSQNHLVDLHASALSNATDTIYADTELFAQSQLNGQSKSGLQVLPSEPASLRRSVSQRSMPSSASDLQAPQQHAEFDRDAETKWQDQKDISISGTEGVDGSEGVPEGKGDSPRKEQQESELATEGGMTDSNLKEMLSPDTEGAARIDDVPQQRTPGREQQGGLHGDYLMEQQESLPGDHLMEEQESLHGKRLMDQQESLHGKRLMEQQESLPGDHLTEQQESLPGDHLMELNLSPEEHHSSNISTPKSSTSVDDKRPVELAGGRHAFLQDKSTKRSVKATVEHIIGELDKNMALCVVGQGASEADPEEESFPSGVAAWISQSPGAGTPRRSVSRQEAEQVEREAADEAIQESGAKRKSRAVPDLEGEADVISEGEMEPGVEDTSEAEMDSENNGPPVKTPAYVHKKAFQCTPLLSTPHTLKPAAPKSASKSPSKKQVPKGPKRARGEKRQPGLSSSWVKKIFIHYAKMPMTKDAFQVIERCISLYFKHLSDDLEAYTNHAGRKTVESTDLELLMQRQGLVTDKIPLHVLIERYLPLEYRKLLIPVATSGNKVTPLNP